MVRLLIWQVHAARRVLSEQINFPALLAFSSAPPAALPAPSSALSAALPPNAKLVTLTSNYASHNGGKLLLRLSHLYQARRRHDRCTRYVRSQLGSTGPQQPPLPLHPAHLLHPLQVGEHPTLAQPVEIDLQQVFGAAHLKIVDAVETTLSGNDHVTST